MANDLPRGPESRFFLSQRLRLHYVDWGNEAAPPLLMLHGGRDHCRNWDWVARGLQDRFHILAADLRGHGESQWSAEGHYSIVSHVYDLAQIIHLQALAPVTIVAHSFGGFIAAHYAGLYPQHVAKLVIVEGLTFPKKMAERYLQPQDARTRDWIESIRALSSRQPRRYASIEDAQARMQAENARLTEAQARHLTVHGLRHEEDGSFTWKFDNYVRSRFPFDMTVDERHALWAKIRCPVLLVQGSDSWAPNPDETGEVRLIPDARVVTIEDAGHWPHHDRLDVFLREVSGFLEG